ncbi:hypothetical protein BH10PLA2_BH10PLA2_11310 [soil metagenome]
MRVAIISTPRSGNTWLLHLLGKLYNAATVAVHSPIELDWESLPPDSILQIHWHPEPSFLARLDNGGFRVVVVARHPLDVLISILQFSLHEPTARWLEGEAGNERPIFGAMPRSTAFLDYCIGARARALLSISLEWWSIPTCHTVKYENLVAQPIVELTRLTRALQVVPVTAIESAVAATTLQNMRVLTKNKNHFWQGQFNLWKKLLTAADAAYIHRVHADIFATIGYECDANVELDGSTADANWLRLVWAQLTEDLHTLRQFKQKTGLLESQAAALRQELAACHSELGRMHAAYTGLEQLHANVKKHQATRRALGSPVQEKTAIRALKFVTRLSGVIYKCLRPVAIFNKSMRLVKSGLAKLPAPFGRPGKEGIKSTEDSGDHVDEFHALRRAGFSTVGGRSAE